MILRKYSSDERIIFFDWSAIGSSEERGGGAENEPRNFVREDCFEKRECIRCVVAKIRFGKFHGLAGFDGCGHVNDAVEFVFLEDAIEELSIGRVAFDEFRALRNGGFVAVPEIVVDDDVVAPCKSWVVTTLPMYPAPPVTSTRSGMAR